MPRKPKVSKTSAAGPVRAFVVSINQSLKNGWYPKFGGTVSFCDIDRDKWVGVYSTHMVRDHCFGRVELV